MKATTITLNRKWKTKYNRIVKKTIKITTSCEGYFRDIFRNLGGFSQPNKNKTMTEPVITKQHVHPASSKAIAEEKSLKDRNQTEILWNFRKQ